MVGRPSSELPTFSLDWLCWQCQQFSIKKVVFEEVRRQYLIFEAECAPDFMLSTLSIKGSIYKNQIKTLLKMTRAALALFIKSLRFFQSKEKLSK